MQNDQLDRVRNNIPGAFEEVLKKHERMIYALINENDLLYGDFQIDKDDLYQEACLALHEACLSYDGNRGAKFSTFAYLLMRRRIKKAVRFHVRHLKNEHYSYDKLDDVDYYESFTSLAEDPLTYHARQHVDDLLNKDIKRLSREDKEILRLRIENYSYEEIARMLNIKRKRVDNRLARLKKRYLE